MKEPWNLFINLKVTPLLSSNKMPFKRKSKSLSLKIHSFKAEITDFPTVFTILKVGLWSENLMNPFSSLDPLNNRKIWLKLLLSNKLKWTLTDCKQNICQLIWKFTQFFHNRLFLKMEKTSNTKFWKGIHRTDWLMWQFGMLILRHNLYWINGCYLKEWKSRKWLKINLFSYQLSSQRCPYVNGKYKMLFLLIKFKIIKICPKFINKESYKNSLKWKFLKTKYFLLSMLRSNLLFKLIMMDAQNVEEKFNKIVICAIYQQKSNIHTVK